MKRVFLALVLCAPLAAQPADHAARHARQASAALWQADRVMHAWMKRVDPVTGLLPRTGKDPNWVVRDSAADLYPFLAICSRYTEPALYDNAMPRILRQEYLLTRRRGRLSDDLQPGGRGFVSAAPDTDRIIFASSEYAKDGLLPLVELLGETPWYHRLVGIAEDILRHAPYETPRGRLPARSSEVNGNMLQVWSRLAWKTGRVDFLNAALALADYYLLDMLPTTGYLPAHEWDFATHRALKPVFVLADHGNEIVGGLSEAIMLAETKRPDKARRYREPFLRMIDRLLEVGRNADGVWVSRIDVETGKVLDARHAHCWGYMFNAVYTAYLISGDIQYKQAVERAIAAVTSRPEYLFDESGSGRNYGANAYSDSIEGALVLLNRLPGDETAAAIDGAVEKFLARVRPDGIVEDWYGDGNFIRTALMYVLWKTQGTWLAPWERGVRLGAELEPGRLTLHLAAETPWRGRVRFDGARHREHWRMERNYPRLNEWPEWFTVDPERLYSLRVDGRPQTCVGWDLLAGVQVSVGAGQTVRLVLEAAAGAATDAHEEQAVLAVVQRFFDILASRDPVAARDLFLPEGRFVVLSEKDGKQVITARSFTEFLDGLPKGKEKLLERMWDPRVTIHGALAAVWTPYDFHRDGRFSHCGVDAFHLVKTESGWKITGAIYTVERTGCRSPLPPPGEGR
ncbi:MAG: nuclear transport factor 2 family protein [Acidobacteria bacterium]|nr:nuclear transport factor 2 family protein [Acidobacteriota bacterium]